MNRLKAITLVLIVALANPLCCCLGLEAVWESLLEQPVEEAHSCCKLAMAETEGETAPVKSRDECPHEVERISKIVDGDTGSQIAKPLQAVAFCERGELGVSGAIHREKQSGPRSSPRLFVAAPPGIGAVYCVYLL